MRCRIGRCGTKERETFFLCCVRPMSTMPGCIIRQPFPSCLARPGNTIGPIGVGRRALLYSPRSLAWIFTCAYTVTSLRAYRLGCNISRVVPLLLSNDASMYDTPMYCSGHTGARATDKRRREQAVSRPRRSERSDNRESRQRVASHERDGTGRSTKLWPDYKRAPADRGFLPFIIYHTQGHAPFYP